MREDQFHLVLSSNSSMRYFPQNTTTSFVTELPQAVHLHGEWEVALNEIQFSTTFLHINHGENVIRFVDIKKSDETGKSETITSKESNTEYLFTKIFILKKPQIEENYFPCSAFTQAK